MCVPGQDRFQFDKAKSTVFRCVSTGPQSLRASTGLGIFWRLKVSKVGQDCRMRLNVQDLLISDGERGLVNTNR